MYPFTDFEKVQITMRRGLRECRVARQFALVQLLTVAQSSQLHQVAKVCQRIDHISAMLTFHPQRWTDKPVLWVKELAAQSVKNVVKRAVVRKTE